LRRTAFLLSRLEVEQYLVELPPMSADRVASALGYRLSSLYPGERSGLRFDYLRNGGRAGSFLLFAADEAALAAIRAKAGGGPLVSPTLAAAELAPKGPWACLIWAAAWASLDFFIDGALVDSRRIARGTGVPDDLSSLLAMSGRGVAEAAGARMEALVADEALGERETLERSLSALGLPGIRAVPLSDAMPRVRRSKSEVFPLGRRRRRARRLAVLAAACLDLALAGLLAIRALGAAEAELALAKADCLALQRRNGEALRLVEEAEAKEKRCESLAAEELPDMYAVVASLAAGVGAGAGKGLRMRGLVVTEGAFRLEAEGPDALAALASLEASGDFESAALHESRPLPGGGESFSMSGRYRREARGMLP
jgi:hypothetical protein